MSATPLLCRFELHEPAPFPRWNDGYYFAKCLRCDADLVRVAGGRWQRPHGFRVVWSAEPPPRSAAPQIARVSIPVVGLGAGPGADSLAPVAEVAPVVEAAPVAEVAPVVGAPVVEAAPLAEDGALSRAAALFGDSPQPAPELEPAPELKAEPEDELEDGGPPIVLLPPEDELEDGGLPIVLLPPDAFLFDYAALPVAVADVEADESAPLLADTEGDQPVGDEPLGDQPLGEESIEPEPPLPEPVLPEPPVPEPYVRRSVVPDFMDDDFPATPQAEPYVTTISQIEGAIPHYIAGAKLHIAGATLPAATVGDAGPPPAESAPADPPAYRGEADDRWGLNRIGLKSPRRAYDDAVAKAHAPRISLSPAPPAPPPPLPTAAPAIVPLPIAPLAMPRPASTSAPAGMPGTYQAAAWATVFVLLIAIARLIFPAGDGAAKSAVVSAQGTKPAARVAPPVPKVAVAAIPVAAEAAAPRAALDASDASVSASVLSCRDAPKRSATRTMTLSRGVRVEVMAVSGDWSRIAYRDKPCWVSSKLLAPD